MASPAVHADEVDAMSIDGQQPHEAESERSPYDSRVRTAMQELRVDIQEKEAALIRLRHSSESLFTEPSTVSVDRLRQLHIIKTTFESLTPTEPQLPSPDSLIPALLALRTTEHTIEGTKSSTTDLEDKLVKAQRRLEKEESDLHDAKLITTALESRISSMRQSQNESLPKSSDNSVKGLVETVRKRTIAYDREVKRLVKAFNRFIDSHLAPMLAAEDEGGSVVGEGTEKDRDMSGKNRSRNTKESKSLAAEELRTLTEELLNASVSSGRNRSGAYVNLARDSAASRFLVRAKVAELSPRDARQMRLIDFGRRLDDR